MIGIPFQDNVAFGVGPDKGVQNVLNIQPVILLTLSRDWNLITRTILPLVTQPSFTGAPAPRGCELQHLPAPVLREPELPWRLEPLLRPRHHSELGGFTRPEVGGAVK